MVGGTGRAAMDATVDWVRGAEFARGGYVTSPTYGLVGEAGPEIVAPEDKLEEIFASVLARAGRTGPLFGDVHVHDAVDIELLMRKTEFHIAAGGL